MRLRDFRLALEEKLRASRSRTKGTLLRASTSPLGDAHVLALRLYTSSTFRQKW